MKKFVYIGIAVALISLTACKHIPSTETTIVVEETTVTEPAIVAPIPEQNETPAQAWNQQNPDVVGSISVVNIKDYPVVCTPDNQNEYLNLSIDREYSKNGTLFTAEDAVFAETTVTTIFGHSMKSGDMFGKLKSYENIDFLKENPTFSISTMTEENVSCKVIAVCNVSANYYLNDWYYAQSVYTEEQFEDFVYEMRSRNKFVIEDEFDYNSKYILLSTCAYKYDDERLVVLARVMNDDETLETSNYTTNPLQVQTVEYYEKFGGKKPSDTEIQENLEKQYR